MAHSSQKKAWVGPPAVTIYSHLCKKRKDRGTLFPEWIEEINLKGAATRHFHWHVGGLASLRSRWNDRDKGCPSLRLRSGQGRWPTGNLLNSQ